MSSSRSITPQSRQGSADSSGHRRQLTTGRCAHQTNRASRESSPNDGKDAFCVFPPKAFGDKIVLSRKSLSIPGGRLMLILVPWKPVVFVWLLLSAMFLFWAGAMCVVEGKNPFAIPKHSLRSSVSQGAGHKGPHLKHLHKSKPAGSKEESQVIVPQARTEPQVYNEAQQ